MIPDDNPAMQRLRASSTLARLILAWLVLTLGVAVASPIVSPQSMQLVCTTEGSLKLVVGDDGADASQAKPAGLDCPLCLPLSTPIPGAQSTLPADQPMAHALLPTVEAALAALVGAPLPPRGPPASLPLI